MATTSVFQFCKFVVIEALHTADSLLYYLQRSNIIVTLRTYFKISGVSHATNLNKQEQVLFICEKCFSLSKL